MSFSSLASNQAVTFTDMQSSGVPLNTGQSAVTSTQCMQVSDLINMYAVNTSNSTLVPKASNQLIVKQDVQTALSCPVSNQYYTIVYNPNDVYNGHTYVGQYLNVNVGTTSGTVTIQFSVDKWSVLSGGGSYSIYVFYGNTKTQLYTTTGTTGTVTITYTYTYSPSVGTILNFYIGRV